MTDPTPIDLSPEALERACMELGSPDEPDDMKTTRDVVAGYFEGLGTLGEMVERGARGIARENASKIGHAWPDKFVEANWRDFTDYTRACLQAALTGEKQEP